MLMTDVGVKTLNEKNLFQSILSISQFKRINTLNGYRWHSRVS